MPFGNIGSVNEPVTIHIKNPKLWSPDSPFLYDLRVSLLNEAAIKSVTVDAVSSYFAMRKSSLVKDAAGILRLGLNNQPLFQVGPLDQGWWPDGLYTAPTDEALRFDIEQTKSLRLQHGPQACEGRARALVLLG